jgi:polyhydroxybutyrate depolymerase
MKKWVKRIVRIYLILFGEAAALALVAAVTYLFLNRTNGSLVSSGKKRTYLLHVPRTYDPAVPTPLVISIHGYSEWPAHQAHLSRWNDLADQYGFIVVYPSGTRFPLRWRILGRPGSPADPQLDVTFISDLIDKLEGEYKLDPARIYANGLSNGGGMSFVLACQLSERIAAVGSVSGAYLFPWNACRSSRPVPAIIFHGTSDPIVPYLGGPSRAFKLPFPPVPEWVEALARHNGCRQAPEHIPASGGASGIRYGKCNSRAEVVFYTLRGGGHSWPGGEPMPEFIAGLTSQDLDATRLMWNFFQQHPMPGK